MFSFMIFIFLCFFGILAVLFYMLRSQEKLCQSLREEHAQLRVLLRALESRLDALCGAADGGLSADSYAAESPPARAVELGARTTSAEDPLLRLSFDAPNPCGSGSHDRGQGCAARTAEGVDPALDLHFDPAEDLPRR